MGASHLMGILLLSPQASCHLSKTHISSITSIVQPRQGISSNPDSSHSSKALCRQTFNNITLVVPSPCQGEPTVVNQIMDICLEFLTTHNHNPLKCSMSVLAWRLRRNLLQAVANLAYQASAAPGLPKKKTL